MKDARALGTFFLFRKLTRSVKQFDNRLNELSSVLILIVKEITFLVWNLSRGNHFHQAYFCDGVADKKKREKKEEKGSEKKGSNPFSS